MLEIRQINKHFAENAFSLKNINCNLTAGLYVLIGPNGSGKSTLLRIAAGIMRPDSGQLLYSDQDIYSNLSQYKYKLGYMPQTLGFYSHMTGLDFLMYLANLKGIFGVSAKKRAHYTAELLGIAEHSKKKISTWSVGLRQRLGIAQALLNDPDILILDEPFCGLAFEENIEICNLLSCLARTKTILLSSHLTNDLPITKLLLLVNGQLQFAGFPLSFIEKAKGQVWTGGTSKSSWCRLQSSFPNSTAIFTENECRFRIISSTKPALPNIESSPPNLEEAYLIWLQQLTQSEANIKYDHRM
jgi:ABC-type multidrug transport system ATPase subunit